MNLPSDDSIVLFVDDEPLIRKYFARTFGRELNVKTAGSGEEARAVLATYGDRVAVLITDQRMPASDGVSLLSHAKRDYPLVVRLLTTAYSDIDDAVAAVNQGEIWRYISKPWDLEDLRATLAQAMDIHRTRAQEQVLLSERRRGMLLVASHIAHEMRTPLRSIHSAALGLEKYLPLLLEGHAWAIRNGADIEPITKRHQQILEESTATVKRVVNRANTTIDLLLANTGACRIDPTLFVPCSMAECVSIALEDYPFTEVERETVGWAGGPEFSFSGTVNLMVLILHNLLKNALRAVAAAGRGDINIWTDVHEDKNMLYIRDTGTGIAPELVPKIFDDFASFANDHGSAGVGLGFCRKVMMSFGGHIHCHSEVNRYTQFDLWLPAIDNQDRRGSAGTTTQ